MTTTQAGADEVRILAEIAHELRRAGLEVPEIAAGGSIVHEGGRRRRRHHRAARRHLRLLRPDGARARSLRLGRPRALDLVLGRQHQPPGGATIDGGSKTFSGDRGLVGSPVAGLDGLAVAAGRDMYVERFTEEHGMLAVGDGERVALGEKLRFYPTHACTAVNLADELIGCRGDRVEVVWPVARPRPAHLTREPRAPDPDPHGGPMPKTVIRTDAAAPPLGAYSQGIRAGDFIFVTGCGRSTRDGTVKGETVAEQTEVAIDNIEAILRPAGRRSPTSSRRPATCSTRRRSPSFNEVYARRFPEPRPGAHDRRQRHAPGSRDARRDRRHRLRRRRTAMRAARLHGNRDPRSTRSAAPATSAPTRPGCGRTGAASAAATCTIRRRPPHIVAAICRRPRPRVLGRRLELGGAVDRLVAVGDRCAVLPHVFCGRAISACAAARGLVATCGSSAGAGRGAASPRRRSCPPTSASGCPTRSPTSRGR